MGILEFLHDLANKWGLSFHQGEAKLDYVNKKTGYYLKLDNIDGFLKLHNGGYCGDIDKKSFPLSIDLLSLWMSWNIPGRPGSLKSDLLWRALGLSKRAKDSYYVLDATAGLGRDSFRMLFLGCTVVAIEQSPLIGALLDFELARIKNFHCWTDYLAKNESYKKYYIKTISDKRFLDLQNKLNNNRLTILAGDSVDIICGLRTEAEDNRPKIIYIDPMYKDRDKHKASAGKQMRIMRNLIQLESDEKSDENDQNKTSTEEILNSTLLSSALKCALQRVIVKRAIWAKTLSEVPPHTVFRGKSTRYDTYFVLA